MSFVSVKETEVPLYRCDDLTRDLCDLQVERGSIVVRGIEVTYWKYRSTESKLPPIVTIHGGPAFTHNYMLPLKQLACRGRVVVFYDQAGCGESAVPNVTGSVTKAHPWLLDPLYYASEELPTILEHLAWDSFHIVGNSWGTMVAQMYAAYRADNLEQDSPELLSMVLSGPLSDGQTYIEAQWDPTEGSLGNLPPYLQERIQHLEAAEAYDSLEYQALDQVLTGYFTVRTQPPPDCVVESLQLANREIYEAMQGASEFAIHNVLAKMNLTGDLHKIQVPVLLSHGRYDTMRPPIIRTMQEVLPFAETLYLERSGHMSMIDEPGRMNDAIDDFFGRVETGHSIGVHKYDDYVEQVVTQSNFTHWNVVLSALCLLLGFILGNMNAKRQMRSQYTIVS